MMIKMDWSVPRWFEARDLRDAQEYVVRDIAGQTAEIIVYFRALTKEEGIMLQDYINEKYRLTLYYKIKAWLWS